MSRLLRFGQLTALIAVSIALQACAGTEDDAGVAVGAGERAARVVDLDVRLSLDQVAYAAHEPVLATVTVTNRGRGAVRVLAWRLPDADLEEPLFRVLRAGGNEAEFVGPHYKRPPATEADFVHLASGASLTRTVDLARFYDLSNTGDYKVTIAVEGKTSNSAVAWIEGRAAAKPEPPTLDPGSSASLGFSGRCSASQQTDITNAVAGARVYSQNALDYLDFTPPSGTPRYTTWFGAFNLSRWNTVANDFFWIDDAFDNEDITVDCKCKKNYYAYVYPNQPYTIYVCRAFWDAPPTGTDSKAGTLIHEMSHFNVTAGTDDVVYGKSACRSLAISDPDSAIQNADSHEYFAENSDPSQL